jgi:hypothetical protein
LTLGYSGRAVARWLETEGAAGLTADVARRLTAEVAAELRDKRRAAIQAQFGPWLAERIDSQIRALRAPQKGP